MKCPRDGWELRDGEIEGVPAHRCPRCNGFSFELSGNEKLTIAPDKLKAAACESPQEGALISPVSGKPMWVFHYRGVELDYCDMTNSVWLDRGELEKISRADVSRLKRQRSGSNPLFDGLDVAVSGVDVMDFVITAVEGLFDV